MNHYVTGSTIKSLREKQRLTQSQLAEKLCVSLFYDSFPFPDGQYPNGKPDADFRIFHFSSLWPVPYRSLSQNCCPVSRLSIPIVQQMF